MCGLFSAQYLYPLLQKERKKVKISWDKGPDAGVSSNTGSSVWSVTGVWVSRCHIVSQFNEGLYDIIIASDETLLEDPKNKPSSKAKTWVHSGARGPGHAPSLTVRYPSSKLCRICLQLTGLSVLICCADMSIRDKVGCVCVTVRMCVCVCVCVDVACVEFWKYVHLKNA